MRLTVTPGHAAGYLNKDSRVTEDHDDQRQEEEAHEGEHVVEGLLPVLDKTAVGGALGEVLRDCDGHIVKYKHLHEKTRRVLLRDDSKSIRQTERKSSFHLGFGFFSLPRPVTRKSTEVRHHHGCVNSLNASQRRRGERRLPEKLTALNH